MQEINIYIFQFINGFSSNAFIEVLAPLCADIPIFFLPLFLTGMWLYYSDISSYWKKENSWFFTQLFWSKKQKQEKTKKKHALLHIFYACVIAILISLLIQQFIDIERPETAITWSAKLLLEHIPDASFPSDHASVGVAFLGWLFLFWYRKVFWYFLPFICLMMLSRVIVGVHWPFDIIAGISVWIVSVYISWLIWKKNTFVKNINLRIIQLLSYMKL